MGNFTALLVDPGLSERSDLVVGLTAAGYDVMSGPSPAESMKQVAQHPDLVLLDGTRDSNQLCSMVTEVRSLSHGVPILLIGDQTPKKIAVPLSPPFATLDNMLIGVREALGHTEVDEDEAARQILSRLIGRSSTMIRLARLLVKIARSPSSTVLITGETGTGKSLAARCLHDVSSRRSGPFVNVACVSVPSPLFESELFGHERGAFTDAREMRRGLLEQAHQGTVFLDEAGDIDHSCQAKLLHFLEEHSFRRLGGRVDLTADVRVVAATNVDLGVAIRNHVFRQDLYYRLAVITVHLPPLRERREDIAPLCHHYLRLFALQFNKPLKGLTPEAMQLLEAYDWPGNVRELKNIVERGVLLGSGSMLDVDDVKVGVSIISGENIDLPQAGINLEALERSFVTQALERCSGNRSQAAALLGITRDQMRYRVEKYRDLLGE